MERERETERENDRTHMRGERTLLANGGGLDGPANVYEEGGRDGQVEDAVAASLAFLLLQGVRKRVFGLLLLLLLLLRLLLLLLLLLRLVFLRLV